MLLTYFVAFLSLFFLIIFHEFFHFFFARRYGLRVKEFGIGYPPHLFSFPGFGTRIAIGLLPFGGYVMIDDKELEKASFWAKMVIVLSGVISFWLFSFVLLTLSFTVGLTRYSLEAQDQELTILRVLPSTPAYKAGLKEGDKILFVKGGGEVIKDFKKVSDFLEFIKDKKSVTLGIEREGVKKEIRVETIQRQDRRIIGVALSFKSQKKLSLLEGVKEAWVVQKRIATAIISLMGDLNKLSSEGRVSGPVGVFYFLSFSLREGVGNFLFLLGVLSFNLFLINSFPLIPITDGGRALRILLGKVFGVSLSPSQRKALDMFFFVLFLGIMVIVTWQDLKMFWARK